MMYDVEEGNNLILTRLTPVATLVGIYQRRVHDKQALKIITWKMSNLVDMSNLRLSKWKGVVTLLYVHSNEKPTEPHKNFDYGLHAARWPRLDIAGLERVLFLQHIFPSTFYMYWLTLSYHGRSKLKRWHFRSQLSPKERTIVSLE